MTLECLYFGWTMNWIRQRQAFLQDPEITCKYREDQKLYGPYALAIMGEKGVLEISCPSGKRAEADRLFPEADPPSFSFNISFIR